VSRTFTTPRKSQGLENQRTDLAIVEKGIDLLTDGISYPKKMFSSLPRRFNWVADNDGNCILIDGM
jgi:hypothetical protein